MGYMISLFSSSIAHFGFGYCAILPKEIDRFNHSDK
jgi:hypothetical protein